MRESYHDELNATSGRILTMAELVRVAVKDATAALLGADLTTAERVISDDSKVDSLNEEIERRCFDLLARQAPVAGELRTIVAMLRMCYELARMGDLAAHVAKIARLRFPEVAVPPQVPDQFVEMSKIDDSKVDSLNEELERRCFDLLARHAPVAGELRTLVAMLRMCYELARMGDLAAHVAKIARLRFPEVAVPPQVADQFVEMSKIADSMIGKAEKTLADRDSEAAESLAS